MTMSKCPCAGWRWVADDTYEPPDEVQPPPSPRRGLKPCLTCSPDDWDAPWPPIPDIQSFDALVRVEDMGSTEEVR